MTSLSSSELRFSSDLEEIIDYFADRSVEAGNQFLDEFNKKCRYLTQFPRIGRSYFDIRSYLRGIPIRNYILFYRVIDDGIEIMRVIRGERDLEAIFGEAPE
jgi:toxin ParE1/3/4